jgi:signal transduction histidine kinase
MDNRKRIVRMQIGAGLLTWALVTGLAILIILRNQDEFGDFLAPLILLALINVGAMLVACSDHQTLTLLRRRLAHSVQLASTFAIAWALPLNFLPIYTIIWLAVGAGLYSERVLWLQLIGTMLGWYVVMRFAWGENGAIFSVALYGTFHLFALLMGRVAKSAEDARDRAEFLNSELIATQHLLSEASRQSERTRIARDLHDLLGHHLTALSINLQIAERLAQGEAQEKIAESRALARLLLSDVREAVSTLREESEVDFTQSVRLLVERIPQLKINLDIEDGLVIDEFEVAESLLRCIQEALTNTLRHSGANQSWIRLWREDDGIHLAIRDNGRSGATLVEGNGLAGMRERVERLQGNLRIETVNDALNLHILLPLAA